MTEELGQLVYREQEASVGGLPMPGPKRRHADDTARAIDRAAREIVDAAYERALSIVRDHRAGMDKAAKRLLKDETMEEAALREAFGLDRREAA